MTEKYCKDCRFFQPETLLGSQHMCARPEASLDPKNPDLVTGRREKVQLSARDMRQYAKPCGPLGELWEPKPEVDLQAAATKYTQKTGKPCIFFTFETEAAMETWVARQGHA